MSLGKNSSNEEFVAHIADKIRRAHETQPERKLTTLYATTFTSHWAASLTENYGRTDAEVTEIRYAVQRELGIGKSR